MPIHLVENEEYIYYNKGAIAMYELQELIGEENVNRALRAFINDWNSTDGHIKKQTKRYATSEKSDFIYFGQYKRGKEK